MLNEIHTVASRKEFCVQEDPGESLSSSDKEDNEEEDKHGYGSEDDEDGFVVPSGYLSEDEVGPRFLDTSPCALSTAGAWCQVGVRQKLRLGLILGRVPRACWTTVLWSQTESPVRMK